MLYSLPTAYASSGHISSRTFRGSPANKLPSVDCQKVAASQRARHTMLSDPRRQVTGCMPYTGKTSSKPKGWTEALLQLCRSLFKLWLQASSLGIGCWRLGGSWRTCAAILRIHVILMDVHSWRFQNSDKVKVCAAAVPLSWPS